MITAHLLLNMRVAAHLHFQTGFYIMHALIGDCGTVKCIVLFSRGSSKYTIVVLVVVAVVLVPYRNVNRF